MIDPFKFAANVAKSVSDHVVGNAKVITNALLSQFTSEGLNAVRQGEIFLSEQMLDRELRSRLEEDDILKLRPLRCLDDHIDASVTGKKLMAQVEGESRVRIQELTLTPEAQHLRMSILLESYRGENFLGKCAIAVGGTLLKSLVRKQVSEHELGRILEFEDEDKVILKLGELDVIRSLKADMLPGVSASALDLVQCTGASHVNGGIQVRLASTILLGQSELKE